RANCQDLCLPDGTAAITYLFQPATGLPEHDRQAGLYPGIQPEGVYAWNEELSVGVLITGAISLVRIVWLFVFAATWLVVGCCCRPITLTTPSPTWGHRLMGIQFRDSTGRKFDLGTAGLHTLGYLLSMSFLLPQIVSVVLMLTGARGQSLTDVVLG